MVNLRLVLKIIGQLLFLESAMMTICTVVALCYQEDDALAFVVSTALTLAGGFVALHFGREAENNLTRRDAYLAVTSTWVAFSLFGMMPFIVGGYVPDITDAFFETMSGFTTTGATIIDDVETLPHGILVWRSLTQWIGGLGIVFFTVAILPSTGSGSMKIFAAEATGPVKSKMHPRLSTNAKWIWTIYLGLTTACALAFWGTGMSWFDSINYSMSTTATGGFSPHNDSILHFRSASVEYVSILFQFLAGINFTLLYVVVFKRRPREMARNSEFRLYCAIIALATAFIMYLLITRNDYSLERALRSALFQVVTFISTTGLFNDDAAQWPHVTWVALAVCMFVGSCAGSTSGGFKCIRGVMVLKLIRNEFRQILHPNAVLPVKINGQAVPQSKLPALMAFFAIFVLMCLITATIMIMAGIDNTNAVTISLSCMSNVGPTLGTEIGPEMSWSGLPGHIKWICSFLMLVGRLEIMSVLVLFTRGFWRDN